MSASLTSSLDDPAKAHHFARIIARHKLRTRDHFVFEVEIIPTATKAFIYVEFDDDNWGWNVLSDLDSVPMSYHNAVRHLVCRETPFSNERFSLNAEID